MMQNGKGTKEMNSAKTYKSRYLQTFFREKNLPTVDWSLTDDDGTVHLLTNQTVVAWIFVAPKHEQLAIGDMIRKIDFANGDINDYLKHLAGAIINRWS